jgi:hypothetical protein
MFILHEMKLFPKKFFFFDEIELLKKNFKII